MLSPCLHAAVSSARILASRAHCYPSVGHKVEFAMQVNVLQRARCTALVCKPRRCIRLVRAAADTKQAAVATQQNPWAQPGYKGAVVSQLPEAQQAAAFAAIAAGIAAGTFLCAGVVGPAVSAHLPSFLQVTAKSWFPLGPIFAAAGKPWSLAGMRWSSAADTAGCEHLRDSQAAVWQCAAAGD